MQSDMFFGDRSKQVLPSSWSVGHFPRQAVIGLILVLALLAFEIFNFDSTRFALENLLGSANFGGLSWAAILAIAFCAIDFAGLAHLFTPGRGVDEPKEIWYLTGAWLLGATMNAVMTWWAVSITLLNHDFGNEVLTRQQLLTYVPIFVAVLVWLTRILFIGAFSMAGDHFFRAEQPAQMQSARAQAPVSPPASRRPATASAPAAARNSGMRRPGPAPRPATRQPVPASLSPRRR